MTHDPTSQVPIIDVAPLVADAGDQEAVAAAIARACWENGFFYVIGHGVSEDLNRRLEELSHRFFAQDVETKLEIRMALAGKRPGEASPRWAMNSPPENRTSRRDSTSGRS